MKLVFSTHSKSATLKYCNRAVNLHANKTAWIHLKGRHCLQHETTQFMTQYYLICSGWSLWNMNQSCSPSALIGQLEVVNTAHPSVSMYYSQAGVDYASFYTTHHHTCISLDSVITTALALTWCNDFTGSEITWH